MTLRSRPYLPCWAARRSSGWRRREGSVLVDRRSAPGATAGRSSTCREPGHRHRPHRTASRAGLPGRPIGGPADAGRGPVFQSCRSLRSPGFDAVDGVVMGRRRFLDAASTRPSGFFVPLAARSTCGWAVRPDRGRGGRQSLEADLATIIYIFGEERHSAPRCPRDRRCAQEGPIATTQALADIVARSCAPSRTNPPGDRTFRRCGSSSTRNSTNWHQALIAASRPKTGGRLVVVPSHSLGRPASSKNFLSNAARRGSGSRQLPEGAQAPPVF